MVELNAFGMTLRGDLTSPATKEIQSGPPTLRHQHKSICIRSYSRETSPNEGIENALHSQSRSLAHERSWRFPKSETVFIFERIATDHGDECISCQANHEEDFGDTEPEFYFSENPDRPELESGVRGYPGGNQDGGVEV